MLFDDTKFNSVLYSSLYCFTLLFVRNLQDLIFERSKFMALAGITIKYFGKRSVFGGTLWL